MWWWLILLVFLLFPDFDTFPKHIFWKLHRSQQDSNLSGKIPADFYSDTFTTRPLLLDLYHFEMFCILWWWLILLVFFSYTNVPWFPYVFKTFILKTSSQPAFFEPAREDPIWFLVRRLNHSAMAAWSVSLWKVLDLVMVIDFTCFFFCSLISIRFQNLYFEHFIAASRIRTCAWRSYLISSQTP